MSMELPGMMIELSGTSVRNKGAELMTAAICRRFLLHHPSIQFAVPQRFGTAKDRFKYGMWYKISTKRYALNRKITRSEKVAIQAVEMMLSRRLCTECGIVTDQGINAVLDASGFAFGDQLPLNRTLDFVEALKPLKRKKVPVVLLPQAFGPFSQPSHQDAMKQLIDMTDLIFARDDVSYGHLNRLSQHDERIQCCPDLTLAAEAPIAPVETQRPITLIPNSRMLDKLSPENSKLYQDCLAKIILHAKNKNLPLQLLLHDLHEDLQFIAPLQYLTGSDIKVVTDDDPIQLKAILASSSLVISSRFHALAGALSSGVPSISIGWSHKYDQIMSDFQQSEWSLSTTQAYEDIESVMDAMLEPVTNANISQCLKTQMIDIREQVGLMWQKVDQAIGLPG